MPRRVASRNVGCFPLQGGRNGGIKGNGRGLRIAAPLITDYNDGTAITLGANMAALTIRNIDDEVKNRLRLQAAQHGCSMEQ